MDVEHVFSLVFQKSDVCQSKVFSKQGEGSERAKEGLDPYPSQGNFV